eukprot:6437640-Amphidinium_carterae.1
MAEAMLLDKENSKTVVTELRREGAYLSEDVWQGVDSRPREHLAHSSAINVQAFCNQTAIASGFDSRTPQSNEQ